MTTSADPILDHLSRVMFTCADCGAPLTQDDFFDLGLRLPERGESRDDYFSAELLDDISHTTCTEARRAG